MAITRTKRAYNRREPIAPKVETKSIPDMPIGHAEEAKESAPPAISDVRPTLRPTMREEDPRVHAARRAAEIRDQAGGELDDGTDVYWIDENLIPAGWSYEWKTISVLNKENPAYEVNMARHGWTAVPASRHPTYMPGDTKYKTIDRDGMRLMERPKEITDEARTIEKRNAAIQMRQKLDSTVNQSGPGQFERARPDGSRVLGVKSTYERIPIPE